jgi:tRNA pseudouridine38-40 synthase
MRYFIKLSFRGTRFHGWQFQPNARTVQEELEHALSLILREKISLTGAGRTDSGVHATFFYAHVDTVQEIPDPQELVRKINSFVDKDIAVHSIFQVPDDLHARFSAVSRTYHYRVHLNKNPFISDFSCRLFYIPDFELMNEAAQILFEYQDFTSFSKLHTDTKTNICKLIQAKWVEVDNEFVFVISADRFLRNMVRSIVGTLLEVGQHKISISEFKEIIEKKDRSYAGVSVPAHGLSLVDVRYPNFG